MGGPRAPTRSASKTERRGPARGCVSAGELTEPKERPPGLAEPMSSLCLARVSVPNGRPVVRWLSDGVALANWLNGFGPTVRAVAVCAHSSGDPISRRAG